MSLRQDILNAAPKVPTEEMEFPPGSGFAVHVCGLTSRERDLFEEDTGLGTDEYSGDNIRAKLLVRCIRDPATGKKVFAPKDVDALGDMPAEATGPAFQVAMRLSGFAKQTIKDLEKNSEGAPGST